MNADPPSQALIWGTATLMVTIVSCCSLIGVSIMPLISGPSYRIFITLFTGLAVGSLLGSSIFSLMPQAFNLHLKQDKDYLWKSLVIFFGIYLFYFSERLMRIHFDRRARQQQKLNNQQQLQLNKKNKSSNSLSGDSNERLKSADNAKHIRGDNNHVDVAQASLPTTSSSTNKDTMMEISLTDNKQENEENEIQLHHHHHHHHHLHHLDSQQAIAKTLKGDTDQQGKGPLARRKGDIAPVAWMIIIGDGLHNFIDGLTIGAAFSQSIWLGVNTSIAVIFEEFPHELGDFAVLISSGMTVRQALGFNFLSACTCYIGMVFGIVLGDMTQSASYIFALAGGMFLYISLVDMMGELSAMLEESKGSIRDTTRLLVMQNIGILSGIIIIFILSLYQ